ncbi:MAG: chorismate--pyruvate lyase [Lachnospiraceae bacterium]|nr:chorismate--pyruvate lyase [Lachnospiraceae bacterium]
METWFYEIASIDGDYAKLRRTDVEEQELKLVARALLPSEIYEGCKLKYEMFQYEIL